MATLEAGELVTRPVRPNLSTKSTEPGPVPKPAAFVPAGKPPSTLAELDALAAAWRAEIAEAESRAVRLDEKIAAPARNWLIAALSGQDVDPADLEAERDSLRNFIERRSAHLAELAKYRRPLEVAAMAHTFGQDVFPKISAALGSLVGALQAVEGILKDARPTIDEAIRLHDTAFTLAVIHGRETGEDIDSGIDARAAGFLKQWLSLFVGDDPNPTKLSTWLADVKAAGFDVPAPKGRK